MTCEFCQMIKAVRPGKKEVVTALLLMRSDNILILVDACIPCLNTYLSSSAIQLIGDSQIPSNYAWKVEH